MAQDAFPAMRADLGNLGARRRKLVNLAMVFHSDAAPRNRGAGDRFDRLIWVVRRARIAALPLCARVAVSRAEPEPSHRGIAAGR